MGGRGESGFKIPDWAKKIATWAFLAVTGAGFTVYMDTAANKQDIGMMKKNDDRQDAQIAQLQADVRILRDDSNELNRKSISKLDELLALTQRRR